MRCLDDGCDCRDGRSWRQQRGGRCRSVVKTGTFIRSTGASFLGPSAFAGPRDAASAAGAPMANGSTIFPADIGSTKKPGAGATNAGARFPKPAGSPRRGGGCRRAGGSDACRMAVADHRRAAFLRPSRPGHRQQFRRQSRRALPALPSQPRPALEHAQTAADHPHAPRARRPLRGAVPAVGNNEIRSVGALLLKGSKRQRPQRGTALQC